MKHISVTILLCVLFAERGPQTRSLHAQQSETPVSQDIRELQLKEWEPRSMLVTKETLVDKPKYPAIDVHNHLGGGKHFLTPERVIGYLEEMNAAGVETVVNLDGGWGDRLKETLATLDDRHPGRFVTFALLNFEGIDDADWGDREAARLEESFKAGAKGLKIHKSLGLSYRCKDGELMPIDDPKLDKVWQMCAKYRRPVMIHSADPAAFFTPLDRYNERWHELNEHPDWLFYGERFPARDEILAQRNRVIARHPNTTFICAHFGNNSENLEKVGEWLNAYPNMFIDIDARISELGRQPYAARRFLMKYQDRIMFGTDTPCNRTAYRIYYRFLETDDEYFNCDASHHRQGFWPIYGVFLPDDVLEKLYRKNAERILFGIQDENADETTSAADGAHAKTVDFAHDRKRPVVRVPCTEDFALSGRGSSPAWKSAAWTNLASTSESANDDDSRFKVMYSARGIYVLMECADEKIVATKTRDFDELWREDCFEAFLWPKESEPIYFEYEISPRGHELPLLVPNFGSGRLRGWRPWQYNDERRVDKAVHIRHAENGDNRVVGWSAEFMIPFVLLKPLGDIPPEPGDVWRANFYHVDQDDTSPTAWMWSPVGKSFHECEKFGRLVFE